MSVALAIGCGGQTASGGADAAVDAVADVADAADAGPINVCHGYCPQPNGSACTSDCDCYEKCLGGTCAAPLAASIACGGDASVCPSGQHCGVMGTCEGSTCGVTTDCPIQQQCLNTVCTFFGCL